MTVSRTKGIKGFPEISGPRERGGTLRDRCLESMRKLKQKKQENNDFFEIKNLNLFNKLLFKICFRKNKINSPPSLDF